LEDAGSNSQRNTELKIEELDDISEEEPMPFESEA
jgi:hypothetical protein